ncbi:hypothetical protein ATE84_4320 [Aquimarina sp. MAR_2010_214]|uniref:hypothetical protein n=1 Tax=Aquimarina sp. MAR_2010_214 TaxID=1250026 RepID=UPI000C70EA36|nr:hypothetical protein [Aquimarina sp. MAR_2010_214]PKV52213.1 hypothetical protein ATE84_4320 [Aquimarina sp. MAR_2010_214]
MKNLFFAFLALLIVSCSQDQNFESDLTDQSLKKETSLLTFKDWDHFYEEYNSISYLNQDELTSWVSKKHHNALLNSFNDSDEYSIEKETDINTLTNGLLAILNENQEFKVGENIIYFKNGKFYEISKKKIIRNSEWKNNLSNLKKIGEANIELANSQKENKTFSFNAGNGTIKIEAHDFRRQVWKNCSSGALINGTCCTTRYTNSLINRSFNLGGSHNIISELYFDVNMGYHYKGKWRKSGEHRNITVNLSTNGKLLFDNGYPTGPNNNFNKNVSRNLPCKTSDQRILLGNASYSVALGGYGVWHVNIEGTTTQHVNGDVSSNKWTNYINWTR